MHKINRRQAMVAMGAFAALAGCGSGDETGGKKSGEALSANRDGAMADYAAGKQFKAAAPLTFTILYNNHPFYPLQKDWLFWSELTKRTNVTLQPNVVPLSDYENKRSLIIGAGDAPMIIPKTYPGQEVPFVASGAVLPVSDYIDLMPNFKDKIAKWNLQADLDTLRQSDGRFYLLPGLHEDYWVEYTLEVRADILEKLGLETPQTWDDVHAMLKAMKEEYPDSYPYSDRWSVPTPGGAMLNQVFGLGCGARGGWGFNTGLTWDPAAGKWAYTGAMPQYKQMLQFIHTLVQDKLLDPESFTQTDDQAIQKLASGKSFVISGNAQTLVNEYRPPLKKANPKARLVKIPVPVGPLGPIKADSNDTRLENGIMISAKAKDSKNFVAMMQFIDWLWYSDEGQVFAKWGVEGVTHTRDASGFHLAKDVDFVGLNPGAPKHLQKDFGFSNGVFAYGGSTELLQSVFSEEEIEWQKAMNARKALPPKPPAPLNDEEREQAALWQTPLKDHATQNSLEFILGKRDFSEWDAYVQELEAKNMSAYVNLANSAYERYKKEHG